MKTMINNFSKAKSSLTKISDSIDTYAEFMTSEINQNEQMDKCDLVKELNNILDGIKRAVNKPIATSNSHTYTRLRRAQLDIKDAIESLKPAI